MKTLPYETGNQGADILHEAKRLRLLAAALELQHLTGTAANVVPIPGGERVIAIGTPAEVARQLATTDLTAAALPEPDATIHDDGYWLSNGQHFRGQFGKVWGEEAVQQIRRDAFEAGRRAGWFDGAGDVAEITAPGEAADHVDSEGGHHD